MIEEFKFSKILTFSGGGRGPGWDQNTGSKTKDVQDYNLLSWNYQCSIEYMCPSKNPQCFQM